MNINLIDKNRQNVGWVRVGGGIEQKKKKNKKTHGQQRGDCRGQGEWREAEEGMGGINGDGWRLGLGW